MPLLPTAFSKHDRCLVCRRRTTPLHKVKLASILYAYEHYHIVIKHHARCCYRHLDANGLIELEAFRFLPNRLCMYDNETVNRLNSMIQDRHSRKIGIFERFNDIETLTEDHCQKVTGWTKTQFEAFCREIRIIETKLATKNEMIALYRYWLRKGLTQESLAHYENKWSQKKVSRILDRIRTEINSQFVPRFLGASSRNRDFFLTHNTVTSKVLYNLDDDQLVLSGDGTYCRIEKSANNEFQYNTYSSQKKDNLIKPFVLICADGYFVDVYGPYAANQNDALILRHILSTDQHLIDIAEPNKTHFFLDRGLFY